MELLNQRKSNNFRDMYPALRCRMLRGEKILKMYFWFKFRMLSSEKYWGFLFFYIFFLHQSEAQQGFVPRPWTVRGI